jgi:DNA-binding PadR family transcriptional regulator
MTGSPIGPGTLYAALGRLERRGLIAPLPADDRRRPYELTGAGATTLEEQLRELERFARTGLTRLASSG